MPFESPKRKDGFVNRPFLTDGSGFIHKKRFRKHRKFHFPERDTTKTLRDQILTSRDLQIS